MNLRQLGNLIDGLGELRDRLHALRADEKALADKVQDGLGAVRGRAASGRFYRAEITTVKSLVVEDLPALRRLAGRKFLQVVRADLKAARSLLDEQALEAIGRMERQDRLNVYSLEPATAPRKAT